MTPSQWISLIQEILKEKPLSKRFTDSRLVELFGQAQDRFYETAVGQYSEGLQARKDMAFGNTDTMRGSVEGPDDFHSLIWIVDTTNKQELPRSDMDENIDSGVSRDMSGLFWYSNVGSSETYSVRYNKIPPHPHQGTAQAAAAKSITLATSGTYGSVEVRDDYYNGALVEIVSATAGTSQWTRITDYVGSTKVATVDTWGTTPTGTIVYFIRPVFREYVQQYLCWDTALHILVQARQFNAANMMNLFVDRMKVQALASLANWNKREAAPVFTPAQDDRGY